MFLEASAEEIDRARANLTNEDFEVMADDLMFYRSSAYEYLQQRNLPIKSFTGRRPLEFVVQGAVRRYDLAEIPWLDVIVLYDPNREPRVIAPAELEAVLEYFADLRVKSRQ